MALSRHSCLVSTFPTDTHLDKAVLLGRMVFPDYHRSLSPQEIASPTNGRPLNMARIGQWM